MSFRSVAREGGDSRYGGRFVVWVRGPRARHTCVGSNLVRGLVIFPNPPEAKKNKREKILDKTRLSRKDNILLRRQGLLDRPEKTQGDVGSRFLCFIRGVKL